MDGKLVQFPIRIVVSTAIDKCIVDCHLMLWIRVLPVRFDSDIVSGWHQSASSSASRNLLFL